jgi:hypothetical protein
VSRRGPTIEIVTDGSAAEAFVYDTLAEKGVETTIFETSEEEAERLLEWFAAEGSHKGFQVSWEQRAPNRLIVRVKREKPRRKFPRERCPASHHEQLKRTEGTFRAGTHPAGTRYDEEEGPIEMGHCKECGSTLEYTRPRDNPPRWAIDTDIWYRAVDKVKPHWKKYAEPYAAVATTYQRMGGRTR